MVFGLDPFFNLTFAWNAMLLYSSQNILSFKIYTKLIKIDC